jgi:hypothetical protein
MIRDKIMRQKTRKFITIALTGLLSTFFYSVSLQADTANEKNWRTMAFSESDHKYLALSRQRLTQKTQTFFGTQFHGTHAHDMALLQRLLDEKKIAADQRQLLQDMGVILADVILREFNMKWVIYYDQYGRSRALQLKHSDYFFFPITMISRRAEIGLTVDIEALYQQVAQKIADYYQSQRYD